MLSMSKLNTIKSLISKALIDNKISYEDFTTIINEEKNYHEQKMVKSQRSEIERNKLIEDGKRKGVNEIIRQNETVKYQV